MRAFKLDRLDTNNMSIARSSKAASGIIKEVLWPFGCEGMKRQDPEPPVSPVFGPCHTCDAVQCPFTYTTSAAAVIPGWLWQQIGRALVS